MQSKYIITFIIFLLIIVYLYDKILFGLIHVKNIKGNDCIIPYLQKYRLLYHLEKNKLYTDRMYNMICDNSVQKHIIGLRKYPIWNFTLLPKHICNFVNYLERNKKIIQEELKCLLDKESNSEKTCQD